MPTDWDTLFAQVRRSPFNDDPNRIPQEVGSQSGNIAPIGWLEDGSVTADVIRANAVVAGKVDADAITAREIAANTITAAEIAANTITAGQIAAGTITSNEIAANTITAADIAANTITAAQIAANTISAAEIAADSITTSELAANAVITENILAANVTSSRMEVTISGKNFSAVDGSAGAPGYFFDSASTTGLWQSGATGLNIDVAGNRKFVWGGARNTSHQDLVGLNSLLSLGDSGAGRWDVVYSVSLNTSSDERLKADIIDSPLGLKFVRLLTPRAFRWREAADTQAYEKALSDFDADLLAEECQPHEDAIRSARALQMAGAISDEEANSRVEQIRAALSEVVERHTAPIQSARNQVREGRRLHYGLIAQEVRAALDREGVDAAFWHEDPDGRQSLDYLELIAPLMRAVQELADANDALARRVEVLERRVS